MTWGCDMRPLLNLIPEAPAQIGAAAAWGHHNNVTCPDIDDIASFFARIGSPLTSLLAQLMDERRGQITSNDVQASPRDEIGTALLLFAVCPAVFSSPAMPRFASRSAPEETYFSVFRLGPASTRELPSYRKAEQWVAMGTLLDSAIIADIDPRDDANALRSLLGRVVAIRPPVSMRLARIFQVLSYDPQSRNALQEAMIACVTNLQLTPRLEWVVRLLQDQVELTEAGVPSLLPWKLLAHADILQALHLTNPELLIRHLARLLTELPGSVGNLASEISPALRNILLDQYLHPHHPTLFSTWVEARHAIALQDLLQSALDEFERGELVADGASHAVCRILTRGMQDPERLPAEISDVILIGHRRIVQSPRLFSRMVLDTASNPMLFLSWFGPALLRQYSGDRRAAAIFVVTVFDELRHLGLWGVLQTALRKARLSKTVDITPAQRTLLALFDFVGQRRSNQSVPGLPKRGTKW